MNKCDEWWEDTLFWSKEKEYKGEIKKQYFTSKNYEIGKL